MNKENKGDLISRRVLKDLISDKSIPIKFEEEKRGEWQNSSGVLLSDIYKAIDNAPAVEPCKDCEDRRQAEYIRHGSSWHELQALRKFKKEHERMQGEWILSSIQVVGENWYKCSVCGRKIRTSRHHLKEYPYCHCGASMKGSIDNTPTVSINKDFYKQDKSNPINRSDLFQ